MAEIKIRRIAVFCGSSKGANPVFERAALDLADLFCRHGIDLVFGGGGIGLMGVMANKLLQEGREVIGVMPKLLMDMEIAHQGVTKLYIVDTMHQRKAKMAELADAFIALPGGIGTLEEMIEAFTWLQLGYHQKSCALLNTCGYYDPLVSMFENMVSNGFLKKHNLDQLIMEKEPGQLVKRVLKDKPEYIGKLL